MKETEILSFKSEIEKLPLKAYFDFITPKLSAEWNVKSILPLFGMGKSNYGTREYNAIKRFYVSPDDSKFKEIYLNYNNEEKIDSIVWHTNKQNNQYLTLKDLKDLFGDFHIHNVIYDETTDFSFVKNTNDNISYINVTSHHWVQNRNGKLIYKIDNSEYTMTDGYEFSSIVIKLNRPIKTLPKVRQSWLQKLFGR